MPTIAHILARKLPLHCIPSSAMVIEAAQKMVEHNIGALPVLDGTRLVGIFSERDLLRRVIARKRDPAQVVIADVMTTELVTAHINDDDAICLKKMTDHNCRHLPVVEGDQLLGLISARDLMKTKVEGMQMEIQSLTDYIHYVPPSGPANG